MFHKGEHKKVFAYSANTACDRKNVILDFNIDAGNRNDSTTFPKLYKRLVKKFPEIKRIVADAGYKIPYIAKLILDDNRIPVFPYKRPMTKANFFKKYEYVYDEYYDCYICPNDKILKYTTTNREGYREYKSNKEICKSCPHLDKCTESKNHTKLVTRHIWEGYMEEVEEIRRAGEVRRPDQMEEKAFGKFVILGAIAMAICRRETEGKGITVEEDRSHGNVSQPPNCTRYSFTAGWRGVQGLQKHRP